MSGKKTAAAAVKAADTGIKFERVDLKVVDRYLVLLGQEAGGTATERLERLKAFLDAKVPEDKSSTCDVCRGDSDIRLACCPFCGDGAVEEGSADKGAEEAAIAELSGRPMVKVSARSARRRGSSAPAVAVEPAAAPAVTPAVDSAPLPEPGASEQPLPEVVAAEPVKSATDGDSALAVTSSGAIVGPATESDLDASVAKIRALNTAVNDSVYDLGCELFDCYSRKLYLQRRDALSGKPLYKSWTEFVEHEIQGFGVHHTYTLMDVARGFTRGEVELFGTKKLSMVLRLPEEKREEIKGRLGNLSVREVREEVVREVGDTRRDTGRTGFTGTPGSGKPKKPAPVVQPAPPVKGKLGKAPPPQITLALAVGRTKIPLFARPKKEGVEPKRAKRLGDDPNGVWELPNGTKVRLVVAMNRTGELEIQATVEG